MHSGHGWRVPPEHEMPPHMMREFPIPQFVIPSQHTPQLVLIYLLHIFTICDRVLIFAFISECYKTPLLNFSFIFEQAAHGAVIVMFSWHLGVNFSWWKYTEECHGRDITSLCTVVMI